MHAYLCVCLVCDDVCVLYRKSVAVGQPRLLQPDEVEHNRMLLSQKVSACIFSLVCDCVVVCVLCVSEAEVERAADAAA